jgi:hypothetical protein
MRETYEYGALDVVGVVWLELPQPAASPSIAIRDKTRVIS